MEFIDLPENINTLQYQQPRFLPKTFLPLKDIDGNDKMFISVMRLNTCYTNDNFCHLLTENWTTISWRICQKTYL